MPRVNIVLPDDVYSELVRYAKKIQTHPGTIVKMVFLKYYREELKKYEAAATA
ncbi:MAG: ribbon-helix-helix domain-containing protein [Thermoproteus sp.]